jgi:4-amino-4-deoxy-L-arabinose transferase-like glycosyltransferase
VTSVREDVRGMLIFRDLLIALVIGLGAWAVRASAATTFVSWDEPAWVYRSVHFLQALSDGRWADTLLTGHPGVMTMWTGALSLLWHRHVTGAVSAERLAQIGALATLEIHDPQMMRWLTSLLPRAKDGLLIVHALLVVAQYSLIRRLLSFRAAFFAASLLALDPYFLGLSRVLHIDALAASLMLVSVLAALVYLQNAKRRYLLVSGVALAMATLTKSYGLFAAPTVLLLLVIDRMRSAQESDDGSARMRLQIGALVRDVALWSVAGLVALILLWPAMWSVPWQALRTVVGLSFEYATSPGDATASFFRGQTLEQVGHLFYPTVLFFHSTPLVLIGLGLALVGLPLWCRSHDLEDGAISLKAVLAMALFGLVHLLLINLSQKKYDRYVLPTLLAGNVIAVIGWTCFFDAVFDVSGLYRTLSRRAASGLLTVLLVGTQTAVLLTPLSPAYYIAYINPWAGGLSRAIHVLPVGWGEGIDQAAYYLAQRADAADLTVATWSVAGLAPVFPGQIVIPTAEYLPRADYVLLYIGDVQNATPFAARFYNTREPEFVAHVDGVRMAWVYINDYAIALGEQIVQHAEPADLIVLNAPSTLERRLEGVLPMAVLEEQTEADVAEALAQVAPGHEHIFYAEFDGDIPHSAFIRRQLAQNALLLWQQPFEYGALSYYRLLDRAQFRQTPTPIAVDLCFGAALILEAHGLADDVVEYRQSLGVGLRWRVAAPPDADYHLFVHLLDDRGRRWGQHDAPLQAGDGLRATSWSPEGRYETHVSVAPESAIPPGRYEVLVGLYRLDDMQRLEIRDAEGQPLGTEFTIGFVEVLPATVPPELEALKITSPVLLRLDAKAEIVGYDLAGRSGTLDGGALDAAPASSALLSGDDLTVTLFWRGLSAFSRPYDLALRLRRDDVTLTELRAPPVGEGYPTNQWAPGDLLRYSHQLTIPADADSGAYGLYLNLLDAETGEPLSAEDLLLAEIEVEHRQRLFEAPPIAHPAEATWDGRIRLLGYDLPEMPAGPGDLLSLTLYWQALEPVERDYVVFVHVVDAQDMICGQRDSMPVDGQRPTSGWVSGEIVVDNYRIEIRDGGAPGDGYRLAIGLYDPATGERLPVVDAHGETLADGRFFSTRW